MNEPSHPSEIPAANAGVAASRERWHKPIRSRYDRLAAWMNMLFVDHAFFRFVHLNLYRLSPLAWRSAQPLPYQITRLGRQGLRTVISLRAGKSFGSYPLELEACADGGIAFDVFELRSRALPSRETIAAAKDLFDKLEYPVLFHCKSGADRAGMMSALFMALHHEQPVEQARRQLSLRFGHIKWGKTGILDTLFDAYQADQPDGAMSFLDWSQTQYDPDALTDAYKSGKIADFLTDRVLHRE